VTPQPNTGLAITFRETLGTDEAHDLVAPAPPGVNTPPKLAAALDLARRGFSVFPLHSWIDPGARADDTQKSAAIKEAKTPAILNWQKLATTDPKQIKKWWTQWPGANIGLHTSGLLVIDIDPRHGGDESFKALSISKDLPQTAVSRTQSGGAHLIYRLPEHTYVNNSVGTIAPGIDVRSYHGYIVGVGSTIEGRSYEWHDARQAAVAPKCLIDVCKATKPKPKNAGKRVAEESPAGNELALKWLHKHAPEAIDGGRNNTAYIVANKLIDYAAEKPSCMEMMQAWNLTLCFPPLDEGELADVVNNAYRFRDNTAGCSSPDVPVFEPVKIEHAAPPPAVARATPYVLAATPFVWRDPGTIPRREFLYGAHYIRQFVSSTIAPGGVGKSSLVLIEALSMATGRPLLGVQPEKRLRVWYWNGEDPKVETERRVAAACIHYGIAPADLDGWLFVDSGRDAKIVIAEADSDGAKIMRPVVDAVVATIRANEIDVMIVDPFVSCHRVPENDNGGMDGVVKEWGRIADAASTAIELVHHSRKTNGAEVTVEDARGASAVVFATRDARAINTMTQQEAENAGVANRRLHFRCESGKANLAPPPDKADWFQLMSIPLGNGDNATIDNGDKVAVVASWQYPNMLAGVTSDLTAAAFAKIRAGKYRSNPQATEWVGKVVAEVMGFNLGKAHEKAKTRNLIKLWLKNGVLVEVKRKDERSEERSFVEVARDE
jgi:hypothetical protein